MVVNYWKPVKGSCPHIEYGRKKAAVKAAGAANVKREGMDMKNETKKKTQNRPVTEETAAPAEKSIFNARLGIILLAVVGLGFVIYSLVTIAGINGQIRERTAELNEIKEEITVQEIKNDAMSKTYNLTDSERSAFMERIARDELDYVKEGERVFVNVSGE